MIDVAALCSFEHSEPRAPLTPETIKKMTPWGLSFCLEKDLGKHAWISDTQYQEAGASLAKDKGAALKKAQILLSVTVPTDLSSFQKLVGQLPEHLLWIGLFAPYQNPERLEVLNSKKITAMSLELLPRISRAQSMDVLSSQSNLLGYRAVLEAAHLYGRSFPMMMTAAGTIPAARVLVLGAGVAGLQAIATARRLGAIVSAFDVRPAVKEQVESLGATFVDVPLAAACETKGGYAQELTQDDQKRQAAKLAEVMPKQDIVITTALIPGKKAPLLVTQDMIDSLKPGSVIVDLAAASGGNTAQTKPGACITTSGGVSIVGTDLIPSIAPEATTLYARNLMHVLRLMVPSDSPNLQIPWDDELIKGITLTHQGQTLHPLWSSRS